MAITFIVITLLYLFLILTFVFGFDKITPFTLVEKKPTTSFSIIIPFRNEADNLPALLTSIYKLNYPKHLFEVLLVNDESEDQSLKVINDFTTNASKTINITIINNKRTTVSPKKDAITTAINIAKHQWIATTDADCIVPKYWLDSLDCHIHINNPKLITGPVQYTNNYSVLDAFQTLDFLSLMGATIGGAGINKPFLCNGANLAYKKTFFSLLNGFQGNTNIASGDDIFLMEKALQQDKNAVHYLKSEKAIVITKPQPNFKSLIAQRVRWASKTSQYNNTFAKLVGLLVLMMNAIIVTGIILAFLNLFKFKTLAYLFCIKIAIDFLLLYKASVFFNTQKVLKHYTWSCILYPFFSVYVAVTAMFSDYKWKGRRFNK